jgi:hypothetical protein
MRCKHMLEAKSPVGGPWKIIDHALALDDNGQNLQDVCFSKSSELKDSETDQVTGH